MGWFSVSYDRNIGGISGGGPLINFGRNIATEIRRANRFFAPIRELFRSGEGKFIKYDKGGG